MHWTVLSKGIKWLDGSGKKGPQCSADELNLGPQTYNGDYAVLGSN